MYRMESVVCMYVCIYVVCIIMIREQDQKLFDAAREGNLTEALIALDKGADVNWKHTDEVRRYLDT